MKEKLTKQGVRDLSHIAAKPKKKLESPPKEALVCTHPGFREIGYHGDIKCVECGALFDWTGEQFSEDW